MKITYSVEKLQEELEQVLELIEIDEATIHITMDGEVVAVMVPVRFLEAFQEAQDDEWLGSKDDEDEDTE